MTSVGYPCLFLGLKVWLVSLLIFFGGCFVWLCLFIFVFPLLVKSHSSTPPLRLSLLIRLDKHKCATPLSTKMIQPPFQTHLLCRLPRRLRCPLSHLGSSVSTPSSSSDLYTLTLFRWRAARRRCVGGIMLGRVQFRPLVVRCWCGVCETGDRNTVGDWMREHGEGVVNRICRGRMLEGWRDRSSVAFASDFSLSLGLGDLVYPLACGIIRQQAMWME